LADKATKKTSTLKMDFRGRFGHFSHKLLVGANFGVEIGRLPAIIEWPPQPPTIQWLRRNRPR
jgi:hypothetical protein